MHFSITTLCIACCRVDCSKKSHLRNVKNRCNVRFPVGESRCILRTLFEGFIHCFTAGMRRGAPLRLALVLAGRLSAVGGELPVARPYLEAQAACRHWIDQSTASSVKK